MYDTYDEFTLFYAKTCFSQWHLADFTIDGTSYNCAEQWMMANKAMLFGDENCLSLIMGATHPFEQKKLGRMVKNFDPVEWNLRSRDIVYNGNYAKFTQHPHDLKALLESRGALVEASPTDRIWGIGLSIDDPRCNIKEKWQGTNWLGEVLTHVRDDIMNGTKRRSGEFVWTKLLN